VRSKIEKKPIAGQKARAAIIELYLQRFFGATTRPVPMINSAPVVL
jgi:hypothetical protein